jgi:hypothetical protein
MFDFDNDGDLDIHITNGHVIDNVKLFNPISHAQKDLLFENIGGKFRDISAQAGPACSTAGRTWPGGCRLRQRRSPGRRHLESWSAAGALEESRDTAGQLDHDSGEEQEEQRVRPGGNREAANI